MKHMPNITVFCCRSLSFYMDRNNWAKPSEKTNILLLLYYIMYELTNNYFFKIILEDFERYHNFFHTFLKKLNFATFGISYF